jgi:hypothetical protein
MIERDHQALASSKQDGRNRDDGAAESQDADARHRLALLRVLIWAEREAISQGRHQVSEKIREAIARLHPGAG